MARQEWADMTAKDKHYSLAEQARLLLVVRARVVFIVALGQRDRYDVVEGRGVALRQALSQGRV